MSPNLVDAERWEKALKKIVITGMSSFVGAHLCRYFSTLNYQVIGTTTRLITEYDDLRQARIQYALENGALQETLDITQAQSLKAFIEKHRPDFWIHHGGWATLYGSPDYDLVQAEAINVKPLDDLYPYLKACNCQGVLITGSSGEYSNQDTACLETEVCQPEIPYGKSKLQATERAQQLAETYQLPTRIARVFIPYGVLDAPTKLIPSVIRGLKAGESIALSECSQQRDFIDVGDLVKGYEALVQDISRRGELSSDVFNLCSGMATPVRTLLEGLVKPLDSDGSLLKFGEREMRPGEAAISYGSNQKAKDLLHWTPRTLEEGLNAYLTEENRLFHEKNESENEPIDESIKAETSSTACPAVSIVMSVKNGMPFLSETVESILEQTEKSWELIAVDNVSEDGSAEYLEKMARQDPRIKLFKNQQDLGMSGGLNRGLEEASAEWIARMDADDVMMSERLERQLDFMDKNPDVKVSCCRGVYINEAGKEFGKTATDLFTREKFQWYMDNNEAIGLLHPGVIMHRETVLDLGGYRKAFWPAEDIDLWNRLSEAGHLILAQDEVLLKYRLHTQSNISAGFKKGRLKYEWARACMRARRKGGENAKGGEKEPSWDDFIETLNQAPLWERLNHWRKLNAKAFYREAGQAKLGGHVLSFGIKVMLACFLQPNYVFNRLRSQANS